MKHPLHPALVHFPVACWTLALPADLAGYGLNDPLYWRFAGWLISTGVFLAVPAMLAGMLELARIGDRPAVIRTAYRHMGLVSAAWLLYLASMMVRLGGDKTLGMPPGAAAIICAGLGFMAMAAGAWFGGQLVYRYSVGRSRETDGE